MTDVVCAPVVDEAIVVVGWEKNQVAKCIVACGNTVQISINI